MRISLLAVPAVAALAACNPGDRGPAITATASAPVRLSAAQVETVKAGVRASAGNAGGAQFGAIAAARAEGAAILVCGRVRLPGTPQGEAVFLGRLVQGQTFVPDELARQGGTLAATISACRDDGIPV